MQDLPAACLLYQQVQKHQGLNRMCYVGARLISCLFSSRLGRKNGSFQKREDEAEEGKMAAE